MSNPEVPGKLTNAATLIDISSEFHATSYHIIFTTCR